VLFVIFSSSTVSKKELDNSQSMLNKNIEEQILFLNNEIDLDTQAYKHFEEKQKELH
jgi:hypothetical protein